MTGRGWRVGGQIILVRGFRVPITSPKVADVIRVVSMWERGEGAANQALVTKIAKVLCDDGKVEEAINAIRLGRSVGGANYRDGEVYLPVLEALHGQKRFQDVVELTKKVTMEENLKLTPKMVKWGVMSTSEPKEFLDLLRTYGPKMQRQVMDSMIFQAGVRRLDPKPIIEMMNELQVKAGNGFFIALMKLALKNGDKKEFAELLKQALSAESVERNDAFFGQIIRMLGKVRDEEGAEAAFDMLIAEGIAPSNRLYVEMAKVYGRCGNLKRLKEVYELLQIKAMKLNIGERKQLMNAFRRCGDFKTTIKMFKEMREARVEPDSEVFTLMIYLYGENGLLEEAVDMFEEAIRRNVPGITTCYHAIIKVYGLYGDTENAEMLARRCPKKSVDLYDKLLSAYAKRGKVKDMHDIFSKLIDRGEMPGGMAHAMLVKAYGTIGDIELAKATYNRATYEFSLASQVAVQRELTESMIFAHGRVGDPEGIRAVTREITERGYELGVSTMNHLIEAFGDSGELDSALKVYEEMISKGLKPCTRTYNAMVKVLSMHGKTVAAVEIVTEMLEKGHIPNGFTFENLLLPMVKRDELDDAYRYMELLLKANPMCGRIPYDVVLAGSANRLQLAQAVEKFKNMRARGISTDDELIDKLVDRHIENVRKKQVSQFEQALPRMTDVQPGFTEVFAEMEAPVQGIPPSANSGL